MKSTFFLILLLFLQFPLTAISQNDKTVTVSNVEEFNKAIKMATPGTTIVLKNGTWTDVHLQVNGIGTAELPITVIAETAGEVILNGTSKLSISGKYMVVSGLWFKDGAPTTDKEVISFKKDSKTAAYNCRLTNCTISNYNSADKSFENHWVDLWGKNNRVDHNNFTGKTNGGTTLVVWLKGDEHIENNHQIDHNYFGKRPELGVNGGETIRIGTSENSMKSSKTIVENNIFKQCNGEIEIISNKSCDNIYRNNLFIENEGTLTLRHGNRALVENNVFIGNNKPKTGGIRIIGEGHVVRNNFLIGLTGDEYRGPIVVMNGVPNSPLNRYFQVKDADIQNNTVINCGPIQFAAGKDGEKSLAPIRTIFANNLISNTNAGKIFASYDDISGIKFSGNMVDSDAEINPTYFNKVMVDWQLLKSLPMPSLQNEDLKKVEKIGKTPEFDHSKSKRTEYVAGAFNLNNLKIPEAIAMKVGPSWTPVIKEYVPVKTVKTITVEPGTGTLAKAVKNANSGDVIILNEGTYFVESTLKVPASITIKGAMAAEKTIIKSASTIEKPLTYFFRVNEGVKLQLQHITLNGDASTPVKYAVVSPDENEGKKYNLFIDNCILANFTNKDGGSIFKAYVGTFADTISIKNSSIENSYRGLNLSYEKNPIPKYNAEVILLHNTVFKDIQEFAVNYAKSGIEIPTEGGQLKITNCIFSKIYNEEKGYVIKIKGIASVQIENTVFENSYKQKTLLSLSGATSTLNNCLVYDNGGIKTSNSATANNVVYKNPKWEDKKLFIPSSKSPLLKEDNGIALIGLQPK